MAGTKNTLKQFNTITNGDMTQNLTSLVTDIRFLDDIGYQFTWTGGGTSNVSVQISADYNQDYQGNVINPGHWITVPVTYFNGTTTVTANSVPTSLGSPIYVELTLISAPWIRCQVSAGSAGSITATITAKEI